MAAGRTRVKRRHGILYVPIVFILIAAALVFGLSVFFRVSEISVEGNSIYTDEEIIEASGLEEGDNLFFINRISAVSRIFSRLPYVNEATVERTFPNKIQITVNEGRAIAYVVYENSYYALDQSGKVLSEIDAEGTLELIRVKGLIPEEPENGEELKTDDSQSAALSYLNDLLYQIGYNEMEKDITYIDVEDVSNPSFDYLGRFTVKMGSHKDLEYKFLLLLSAIDEMEDGDRGTLDLSVDNRVHLTYS